MNEISCKLSISYKWWRNDKKAINKKHKEYLDMRAMQIIQMQMRDGIIQGHMFDNIITTKFPIVGIFYSGHWKVVKE
jgi:hypothetical protein